MNEYITRDMRAVRLSDHHKHSLHQEGHSSPPHPRGVSYRKPIDAAKEAVPVLDLAHRLCPDLRKVGAEYNARCPLPDHEDKNPSFYANPDKNLWQCFSCGRGGDVVHLAAQVWGHGDDMLSAAVDLLLTFGHPLPQRPPSWFRKEERQKPIRNAIAQARFEHLRRRLFRLCFKASVMAIEDEAEREAEYRILWDATETLAEMVIRDLSERRSA